MCSYAPARQYRHTLLGAGFADYGYERWHYRTAIATGLSRRERSSLSTAGSIPCRLDHPALRLYTCIIVT